MMLTIVVATASSIGGALITAIVTSLLTRRREREADWRKLKFAQYQEFALALSGVVRERATPERQARYADAFNSMSLIASLPVLAALQAFQAEISIANKSRYTDHAHDKLLNELFHAMRNDMQSGVTSELASQFPIYLLGIPAA